MTILQRAKQMFGKREWRRLWFSLRRDPSFFTPEVRIGQMVYAWNHEPVLTDVSAKEGDVLEFIEHSAYLELLSAFELVLEDRERLRGALQFYGDAAKWIPRHHALSGINPEADIEGENGVCSRQALAMSDELETKLKGEES